MIDKTIPLTDLHRHLDGNIRATTIWELAEKNSIKLPASSMEEFVPMTIIQDKASDLLEFLQKLDYGVSVLATLDDCYRVAYENMEDAKNVGLDYTELRFSPYYMAMNHNLNIADVVAAVADGVAAGSKDYGVKANLIGILSRTFGTETCMNELEGLLAHKDKITALDLAGDEKGFPATLFVEHFNKARDAGWQVTVHAGESDGTLSVRNAIEQLGATRIGHCCAAASDPSLMEYMANNNIFIESCLNSNYQTGTIANLEQHPLPIFLQHGVKVCLNTDDPAVENIEIADEYRVAADVLNMNAETLKQLQTNGVEAAFLSDSEKKELFASKR